MTDTAMIYRDMPDDSGIWACLHADATRLAMDEFTAMHSDTIRQHYHNQGHRLDSEDAEDMARDVWWDIRMFGVDPEIPVQMRQKPGSHSRMAAGRP